MPKSTSTCNSIVNLMYRATAWANVADNAASGGATANAATISFPQCGVAGATLTHVATGSAVSGVGTVWHYGALNASLAVSSGITPQFATGALTVTES